MTGADLAATHCCKLQAVTTTVALLDHTAKRLDLSAGLTGHPFRHLPPIALYSAMLLPINALAPNGNENRRPRDVVWVTASAVDNIHEISGRVAEKETAKSPVFLDRAVNQLRSGGANGNLGGLEIVHADGNDR